MWFLQIYSPQIGVSQRTSSNIKMLELLLVFIRLTIKIVKCCLTSEILLQNSLAINALDTLFFYPNFSILSQLDINPN